MWLVERKFAIVTLLVEIVFIVIYGLFVEFDYVAMPPTHISNSRATQVRFIEEETPLQLYYSMFQDIHVMIFIGFGFLYTFLYKYGYTAVGCNMFISAFLIQWAILCEGFTSSSLKDKGKIQINVKSIITADVAAAAGLISWGGLLGKTSPLQMLIMGGIEIFFYALNEWIVFHVYQANDPGTSMTCHTFGAYFGLAVSFVLHKKDQRGHPNEKSNKTSDVFSMIGTIFLWAFWPSFNAVLLIDDERYRAVINTYLSMMASCVVTFCVSSIVNKKGKFNMVHVQNATLAGGVAMGCVCNLLLVPYAALLIGSAAGLICTLGYKYLQPLLAHHLRIHDTCGINNLHGMSGILSGVIGAILAALASKDKYGLELYKIYPAMVPLENSTEYAALELLFTNIEPGSDRSPSYQAAYQVYALLTTFGIAIGGGLCTGFLICWSWLDSIKENNYYDDINHWEVEQMEDAH